MQISRTKNWISKINTVVRVDRDKFKQVKLNTNLSSAENERITSTISRHDSIFQEYNFKILSQDSIINEFPTQRYQVYINKETKINISKDERYVPDIKNIKRLWFKKRNIRGNECFE